VRAKLGPWIFGVDEETLGSVIARWLRQHNATMAIFESNTRGALLEQFPPEDRDVLVGHFVDLTALDGCESCADFTEANARSVANAMRQMTGADFALALMGSDDPRFGFWAEDRGETWLALAMDDGRTLTKKLGAAGADDFTRSWLTTLALAYVYRRMREREK